VTDDNKEFEEKKKKAKKYNSYFFGCLSVLRQSTLTRSDGGGDVGALFSQEDASDALTAEFEEIKARRTA